jgi:hypothetical protein
MPGGRRGTRGDGANIEHRTPNIERRSGRRCPPGLAAAVGGVGPGGADEGDVVAFARLDAEANGDDVEEGAVDAEFGEVGGDVEVEFVGAGDEGVVFEQGAFAAAVGIGDGGEEEGAVAKEIHAHASGGAAVGGVEDVGGEFWHSGTLIRFRMPCNCALRG